MSRAAGTVPILLAVAVAVAGAGFQALQTPGPTAEPGTLRVATWNVHRFQATDPDGRVSLAGVRDTLERMDADVVGLQESEMGRPTNGAFDAPGWLADELGYHLVYGPPTRDQIYGVVLLSAFPVLESHVVELPTQGTIERVATRAVLDAPGGPLPVVVTHLSVIERPADRLAQARLLVDLIGNATRGLLVGDMNSPAQGFGEEAYEVLNGTFTDAWLASGRPPGSGKTAFGAEPTVRIDHVWMAGNGTAEAASTWGSADLSDHRAVLAEVDLPPAQDPAGDGG